MMYIIIIDSLSFKYDVGIMYLLLILFHNKFEKGGVIMPEIDRTLPLFTANAGVACDWADANAGAGSELSFSAAFKRGINLNIGAVIFADIDAAVQKFIAAKLTAEAHGQANLTAQLQMPMNLFDEAGVAIRLEAKAEAAAGVSFTIGLSIGDFLDLIANDPKMKGIPEKLLIIFLEEATIQAGGYAKVAASAMAYADLSITGSLVSNTSRGTTPGFTIMAEAGAGLEAGAGFRFVANAGITDPRKLILRSLDVTVDELVNEILKLLPDDDKTSHDLLNAFRAPSKTALRIAYEIGQLLTEQVVTHSDDDAEKIAMRCVQVILEESQRYILDRLVSVSLKMFEEFLDGICNGVVEETWNSLEPQRNALTNKLSEMPNDPFATNDLNDSNRQYWMELIQIAVELILAVPGLSDDDSELQSISMLWVAVQLLFKGMERATKATAAAQVIGLEPQEQHAAFADGSINQPHNRIKSYLNVQLGKDPSDDLILPDLAVFLVTEPVIELLTVYCPDVERYFDIFRTSSFFENNSTKIASLLLNNLGGFVISDNDKVDNRATLHILLTCLQDFLNNTVKNELVPIIDEHIADHEDLHIYFHEVVIASLQITTDIIFVQILDWQNGDASTTQTTMKDTLSSVLMMLLGRSLVCITDILSTHVRNEVQDEFIKISNDDDLLEGIIAYFPSSTANEELKEIAKEMLNIGADVFGPLPEDTRAKIRELLYEILAPLPASNQEDFWTNLKRENSIPDLEALQSLGWEMTEMAANTFNRFVTRVLQRIAELSLEYLMEEIEEIIQQVEEWIDDIEEVLQIINAYLNKLLGEIEQMLAEIEQLFIETANRFLSLLDSLSHGSGQVRIREQIINSVIGNALFVLYNNSVYKVLPDNMRREAENSTKNIIHLAFDNDIANSVWDAIGSVASDLDTLVDDIRDLDPNENLVDQLSELMLDRIEGNIENIFGDNPKIEISFNIKWEETITYVDVFDVDYAAHHWGRFPTRTKHIKIEKTINLGQLELPTTHIMNSIRLVFSNIDNIKIMINNIAGTLQQALTKELELNIKEQEKTDKSKEKVDIEKQLDESRLVPRDMNIYDPSPGALYNDNLHVDLEMYGVPMSFLGLGEGEQQRVFIWINGEDYSMQEFVIEEVYHSTMNTIESGTLTSMQQVRTSDLLAVSTSEGLKEMHTFASSTMASYSARMRMEPVNSDSSLSSVKRYTPGADVGRWGTILPFHDESLRKSSLKKNKEIDEVKKPLLKAHPITKSTLYRSALQAHGKPIDHIQRQRSKSQKGNAILSMAGKVKVTSENFSYTTTKAKAKIGKKPTASEKEAVSQTAPYPTPYLRMKLNVPIESLEEGLNTLVVVIADGRSKPIQQAVTFIVSEAQKTGDNTSPYHLPIQSGIKPNRNGKPIKMTDKVFMTPKNIMQERIKTSGEKRKANKIDPKKVIGIKGGYQNV